MRAHNRTHIPQSALFFSTNKRVSNLERISRYILIDRSGKRRSPHIINTILISVLLTLLSACESLVLTNEGKVLAGDASIVYASSAPNQVEVTIDNTQEHQTIDGFGATHLSLVYEGIGDVLNTDLRAEAIDAAYNQVGLTLGNLEGDLLESPGGYDQRTNDNSDPSNFNWNGFQSFRADVMKTKVVDLAEPLGFDDYFVAQKVNVRWASPWLDDIRDTNYDLYLDEVAEQVAAGHIYWRDTYQIAPDYQMLFNEPLSGNDELLNGTTQDVVDIVKRAGARLNSEGFSQIKFVIPNEETEQKSINTATAVLSDPVARPYVGAIGYHPYPYGSTYASIPKILNTSGTGNPDTGMISIRNQLRDLGQQYGIPVWMTEVSHGGVDPRSFDSLRGRAIHIHDELIYADAAAYFGMMNMWDTISQQGHFGNSDLFSPDNEGTIVFIENDSETVTLSGMGYAIGHYARWINKGAVRIDSTTNDPLLQVTAFRDDTQGQLVLVVINNAASARTLNVNMNELTLSGNLNGEQSTATAYWQSLTPFSTDSSSSFTLTVPAESVTTIVGQIGTPPPIPECPDGSSSIHDTNIENISEKASVLFCTYLPMLRNTD